ncbi:hypothetical protein CROQUDRAFT_655914 [Cronartium quercuum f. sp. fusiforme G11]|uniref:Dyp-type peroxidase n=1 Tax=Cronartium quercuum f. sp. fusiforme G11 TaxID=708437 RepID=A0A9P6NKB0_9BASI|nr:hypothetical protein CROQUDRAFT_655914 [Cronartium quercuum f. sp. fusiforme G11]
MSETPTKVDADDVQGDVIIGFHKKVQAFVFFSIVDINRYRKALRAVIAPQITSTAEVRAANSLIISLKAHAPPGLLKPFTSTSIAFTARGLVKLGIAPSDLPGEEAFLAGQADDALHHLGDPVDANGQLATWKDEWKGHKIDGVCSVTAPDNAQLQIQLNFFKSILGGSTKILFERIGSVRPGSEAGKEHFGYADGITNPKVQGFNAQEHDAQHGIVDASTIITGHSDGDPAWTKNGSFLVFRELQQLVPEFNQFVKSIAAKAPEGKVSPDEIGARIVGRWKSGASISLTPHRDNESLARNQCFSYSDDAELKQRRCPFVAHVRKANPRRSLQDPEENVLPHLIIRASIPFGPEVGSDETSSHQSKHERGLYFIAYQSSIEDGFQFIQQRWLNDASFPPNAAGISKPGIDIISGQNKGKPRVAQNVIDKVTTTYHISFFQSFFFFFFFFFCSGEYFFVPSIKAIIEKLGA